MQFIYGILDSSGDIIYPVRYIMCSQKVAIMFNNFMYLRKIDSHLIGTLVLCYIFYTYINISNKTKLKKLLLKIHVHCFGKFSVWFILTVTSKYLFWHQAPYIPTPATRKIKTPTTMIMIDKLLTTPTLKESTESESRRGLILSVFTVDMFLKARPPTVTNPNPIICQKKRCLLTSWSKKKCIKL